MVQHSFSQVRRVHWQDTDASGAVHFANYVRYMEETEYAFLRSRGLSVVMQDERGSLGFPRRNCRFEIESPAFANQQIQVDLTLADLNGITIVYQFELQCEGCLIGRGSYEVVCCRFLPGKLPYAMLIPPSIVDRIEP